MDWVSIMARSDELSLRVVGPMNTRKRRKTTPRYDHAGSLGQGSSRRECGECKGAQTYALRSSHPHPHRVSTPAPGTCPRISTNTNTIGVWCPSHISWSRSHNPLARNLYGPYFRFLRVCTSSGSIGTYFRTPFPPSSLPLDDRASECRTTCRRV